jgi:hypothetical protein
VKRFVVLLAGLVVLPLVGWVPPAEAGAATCTITGTISFAPPAPAAAAFGAWSINPGAITCYGLHKGPERFLGQGPFSGSGTYTLLSGGGFCLNQVGQGRVEYTIPTSGPGPTLHVREATQFVLAGAGRFTTPTMQGSVVVTPPYEGDCVSTPVTRATFVAKVLLVRDVPFDGTPDGHDGDFPRDGE